MLGEYSRMLGEYSRMHPAAVSQALHARLASLLAIQTVTPSYYAARGLDRHSCAISYVLGGQRSNLSSVPGNVNSGPRAHAPANT